MPADENAKAAQEAGKAVQEIAKTTRDFGRFVAKIVGGPLEQASGIAEDYLRYARWERQVRFQLRAEAFLLERGVENKIRPISMSVGISLLQAASLEEDDELQDLWARLLANGLDPNSGVEVKRAFVSILEDMGSLEARLLKAIAEAPSNLLRDGDQEMPVRTAGLPDLYVSEYARPPENVEIALWNLVRLGCVSSAVLADNGSSMMSVYLTSLGRGLLRACS
jgi:hypothetical protein